MLNNIIWLLIEKEKKAGPTLGVRCWEDACRVSPVAL